MEHITAFMKSKVTPKDFFLWAGVILALYGSVVSFITLLFEYINRAYPDALASYGDPYSSAIRISMAMLVVLAPTTLALIYFIRRDISQEPGKADIWVRRWAIMLTLFLTGIAMIIDLITLINYFLNGETTTRFLLKVAVVLLVAAFFFMHFLAEQRGYWLKERKKSLAIGAATLLVALLTVVAGFFIIGTPGTVRLIRFDEQKVSDLQSIQYAVINYYDTKKVLPTTLDLLSDPISGFTVPADPQGTTAYEYKKLSDTSFSLCATFNKPSQDLRGQGTSMSYPSSSGGENNSHWDHQTGHTCFTRTVDPAMYGGKILPVPAR